MNMQMQVISMFSNLVLPNIPSTSVISRADCALACYYSDTCKSFFLDASSCHLHDAVILQTDASLISAPNVQYYVLKSDFCPFEQGYSYVDCVNLCYKIFTTADSWTSAQQICNNENGQLLELKTPEQVNWASAKMQGGDYWIGVNSKDTPDWRWPDNTPLGYANWAPNSPSNSHKCSYLKAPTGVWDSASCSSTNLFICHVPMMDC